MTITTDLTNLTSLFLVYTSFGKLFGEKSGNAPVLVAHKPCYTLLMIKNGKKSINISPQRGLGVAFRGLEEVFYYIFC